MRPRLNSFAPSPLLPLSLPPHHRHHNRWPCSLSNPIPVPHLSLPSPNLLIPPLPSQIVPSPRLSPRRLPADLRPFLALPPAFFDAHRTGTVCCTHGSTRQADAGACPAPAARRSPPSSPALLCTARAAEGARAVATAASSAPTRSPAQRSITPVAFRHSIQPPNEAAATRQAAGNVHPCISRPSATAAARPQPHYLPPSPVGCFR